MEIVPLGETIKGEVTLLGLACVSGFLHGFKGESVAPAVVSMVVFHWVD